MVQQVIARARVEHSLIDTELHCGHCNVNIYHQTDIHQAVYDAVTTRDRH